MATLNQILSTQAGKEQAINENFDALSHCSTLGRRASAGTGLTLVLYGGRFKSTTLADQTVTLAASSTTYVEADAVTGTVSINTTGWSAGTIRLGIAVTSATGLTSYTAERDLFTPRNPRISKSVAGAVDVTLTDAEAGVDILELTGAITANINVISPHKVKQWTVFNNTTGAFTVTIKLATGTGIVIGTGKRAIVYGDGTNVVRVTADL